MPWCRRGETIRLLKWGLDAFDLCRAPRAGCPASGRRTRNSFLPSLCHARRGISRFVGFSVVPTGAWPSDRPTNDSSARERAIRRTSIRARVITIGSRAPGCADVRLEPAVARNSQMNVRRTMMSVLVTTVAVGVPVVAARPALSQDYGPHDSQSGYYAAPNAYQQPSSSQTWGSRWSWHRSLFHTCYEPSCYRPIQPNDWGCGPYGPRHNLNASQMNPSGMTWW